MKNRTPVLELAGSLSLFGYPPREASVGVLARSRAWRALRASAFLGCGLLMAPLVGIIPPHAPWVAGSLGFAGFFGIRKWRERFTLVSFRGNCPRCGEAVRVRSGTPLRPVLSVPCGGCHHDSRLSVDLSGARMVSSPSSGPSAETEAREGGKP